MIAVLYAGLAIFVFLGLNGHHAIVLALVESYDALPIGGGSVGDSLVGSVAAALGLIFLVAVQMAAPVVFSLLIVESNPGRRGGSHRSRRSS